MAGRSTPAWALLMGASLSASIPGIARAHFSLLEPESWSEQGFLGDPQKDGPCGDDGSATPTDVVTTYQAGDKVTVRWRETIYHPGHWRIAIARDRSELQDPAVVAMVDNSCNYPEGAADVPEEYPVLMDYLFPRTSNSMGPEFAQEITIPDMTCERCTLQVIQFMTEHSQPCLYYHCADIKIVGGSDTPVDGGAAGEPAPDAGAGTAGAGGAPAEPPAGAAGVAAQAGSGGASAGAPVAGAAGTGTPTGAGGMPASGAMSPTNPPSGGTTAGGGGAVLAPAPGSAAAGAGGASDDGGCAVGGGSATGPLALWLLVLACGWLGRRLPRAAASRVDQRIGSESGASH